MLNKTIKDYYGTLILCVIVIAHVSLRLFHLDVPSIWYDESYSIYHSQQSIEHIINNAIIDQNPPLYNIILHYWIKLTGNSVFTTRLLSIIFSSISVILIYNFTSKWLNKTSSIFASIIFSLSNFLYYYSVEIRCYSFLVLVCIIQLFLFIELLLNNPSGKKYYFLVFILVILNLVLLFTHYLVFFLLITQFIFFLLYYIKNKKKWIAIISIYLGTFLFFIPWILKILNVIESTGSGSYWLNSANISDVQILLVDYYYNIITALLLLIIIIIYSVYNFRNVLLNYFALIAILPLLLAFITSQFIPTFLSRYLQYSMLGSIFVIVIMLENIKNAFIRILLFLALGFSLFINIKLSPSRNQNPKDAVAYLKNSITDGDLIILSPRATTIPFSYYYDLESFNNHEYFNWLLLKNNVVIIDDKTGLRKNDFMLFRNIYHVYSFQLYAPLVDSTSLFLKNNFKFLDQIKFTDFNIEKFTNPNYYFVNDFYKYDPLKFRINLNVVKNHYLDSEKKLSFKVSPKDYSSFVDFRILDLNIDKLNILIDMNKENKEFDITIKQFYNKTIISDSTINFRSKRNLNFEFYKASKNINYISFQLYNQSESDTLYIHNFSLNEIK